MSDSEPKGIRINIGILSIIILLVLQLIAIAFGYGQLNAQVKFNSELIQTYQTNQESIMIKLDDLSYRTTKLETLLESTLSN